MTVMPLANPAAVIKSMENLDYVRFHGSRVVPTFTGHSMLKVVEEKAPELLSPHFFTQTEYRISQIEAGEFSWEDVIPEYKEWIDERSL
jgi:DNA topoisomerase IA